VVEAGDSLQDKLTEPAFEGNVTAAIFLSKGLKPETFRDRIGPLNIQDIDPDKLSPEMLDKIADHLIAKALAQNGIRAKPETIADWARHRSWESRLRAWAM
jgi:predicted PilT family ATPase